MSGMGFKIWLIGISFIAIPVLTVLLGHLFFAPKYKGKARGKVTDCFRHDTDEHGREAPTGFGKNVSYSAHYVFEVNGEKYRGYGTISTLSRLTRKISVKYDTEDPSLNCVAMSPAVILIPVIVVALWTALVIVAGRVLS